MPPVLVSLLTCLRDSLRARVFRQRITAFTRWYVSGRSVRFVLELRADFPSHVSSSSPPCDYSVGASWRDHNEVVCRRILYLSCHTSPGARERNPASARFLRRVEGRDRHARHGYLY